MSASSTTFRDALSKDEHIEWRPSGLAAAFAQDDPRYLEPRVRRDGTVAASTLSCTVRVRAASALVDSGPDGSEMRWRRAGELLCARLPPGEVRIDAAALDGAIRFDLRPVGASGHADAELNSSYVMGSGTRWLQLDWTGRGFLLRVLQALPAGLLFVFDRGALLERSPIAPGRTCRLPVSAIVAIVVLHDDDALLLEAFAVDGPRAPLRLSRDDHAATTRAVLAETSAQASDAPRRMHATEHARACLDALARLLTRDGLSIRDALARTWEQPTGVHRYAALRGVSRRHGVPMATLGPPERQILSELERYADALEALAAYGGPDTVARLQATKWRADLANAVRDKPPGDVRVALDRVGSGATGAELGLAMRGVAVERRATSLGARLRSGSPLASATASVYSASKRSWRGGSSSVEAIEREVASLEAQSATPDAPPPWLGLDAPGQPRTREEHERWTARVDATQRLRAREGAFLRRVAGGDPIAPPIGTIDHVPLERAARQLSDLVERTHVDEAYLDSDARAAGAKLAEAARDLSVAVTSTEISPGLARELSATCEAVRKRAASWALVLATLEQARSLEPPRHPLSPMVDGESFGVADAPRVAELLCAARAWLARGGSVITFDSLGAVPATVLREPNPAHPFLALVDKSEQGDLALLEGSIVLERVGAAPTLPARSVHLAESLERWWSWLAERAAWHGCLAAAAQLARARRERFAEQLGAGITWIALARAGIWPEPPWLTALLDDQIAFARLARVLDADVPRGDVERERAERLLHMNVRDYERLSSEATRALRLAAPDLAAPLAPTPDSSRAAIELWLRALALSDPARLPAALAAAPTAARSHPWTTTSETDESRRLIDTIEGVRR